MRYRYNNEYLRSIRQSNKYSIKRLSDLLEISERQIIRYEKGQCDYTLKMINRYATVFKEFDIYKFIIITTEDGE